MIHSFDSKIAEKYGVKEAIMLHDFHFWHLTNQANENNFRDGRYWTYNSVRAFTERYPFWTVKIIRTTIAKLVEYGLLDEGSYNTARFDQTKWYSLTDKALEELGVTVCPSGHIDLPQRANENCPTGQMRFAPEGKPIPEINQNYTTEEDIYCRVIGFLNEKAGTRYSPTTQKTRSLIRARLKEKFTYDDFKTVITKKCLQWRHDPKMEKYLRPETLFGTKFEGYLNEGRIERDSSMDDLF